jgi:hypothetical protein
MRCAWIAPLVLAAAACNSTVDTKTTGTVVEGTAAPPAVRVAHQPPTPKDVIEAAMASGSVTLKTSTNCGNVGTEPSDATIGRYLAGFLAELSSPDKKNWIETKIEPGRSAAGEPVSICTVILRHQDGDDRWGWGIQFHVRSSDRLVLANSFSCVGAG